MLHQEEMNDSDIKNRPVIAVTMATSRQGVGVVKELCKSNKYKTRAIIRNTKTTLAIELARLNNVEVVRVDLMDPERLNKAFEDDEAIFGNTSPTKGGKYFV